MLRGRIEEQSIIEELLTGARAGMSGVLVVRGDPGIGKTALLDFAVAKAAGLRTLRASAAESEAELPFAGLHLLLGPALGRIDALPDPQRRAIEGAFGHRAGAPADRLLVGLATLSLLSELAEDGPLLCVVDDAHWLDRSSAEALLFAARRLVAEGIALIIAARDQNFEAPALRELRLTGLPKEDAVALLAERGDDLPPTARSRILDESGGNPLALLELPTAWLGDRLPSTGPLPLTERLELAFHARVAALPGITQTLLLVAAADDTGNLGTVLRAAATLDASDPTPAERAGLIRLGDQHLTFRHPLVRAAIYQQAPLARRQAAHRALAAALVAPDDADRRAWHLAAATTEHDERVAAELEHTAVRARDRSGYAAAAAAYERAAWLTADNAAKARRLTLAAEAANDAGHLTKARALAEQATDHHPGSTLQVRLIQVRADAAVGQGEFRTAYTLLLQAAAQTAPHDQPHAIGLLVEAARAAWLISDRDLATAAAGKLDEIKTPTEALHLSRWLAALAASRPVADLPPPPVLSATRVRPPDTRDLLAGVLTHQDAQALGLAASMAAEHRTRGRIGFLPSALYYIAAAEMNLGRLHDARAHATESLQVAQDTGQRQWISQANGLLAYLAAVSGDETTTRDHAEAAMSSGMLPANATATWALGLLDLGQGRAESALARLEVLPHGRAHHPLVAIRGACDLIEAAVRLGDSPRARTTLAALDDWAGHLRQPSFDALVTRCRALLSPDTEAGDHFTAALKTHDQDSRPFEHARTQLLYGEWLRRVRRKADARAQLRAAQEKFERLSATPWAQRAQTELSATGAATPATSTPDTFAGLTPQELQIVRLASQGLTNRDIATQLFLSPRTVGYHLYKAYPKLGVASRTELAALSPQ